MRTAQDINSNQCEKCGKIQKNGELTNIDEYEMACCNECVVKYEKKELEK